MSDTPGSSLRVSCGSRSGARAVGRRALPQRTRARFSAAPRPPPPARAKPSCAPHRLAVVGLGNVLVADALALLDDGRIVGGGRTPEVEGRRRAVVRKAANLDGASVHHLDRAAHLRKGWGAGCKVRPCVGGLALAAPGCGCRLTSTSARRGQAALAQEPPTHAVLHLGELALRAHEGRVAIAGLAPGCTASGDGKQRSAGNECAGGPWLASVNPRPGSLQNSPAVASRAQASARSATPRIEWGCAEAVAQRRVRLMAGRLTCG